MHRPRRLNEINASYSWCCPHRSNSVFGRPGRSCLLKHAVVISLTCSPPATFDSRRSTVSCRAGLVVVTSHPCATVRPSLGNCKIRPCSQWQQSFKADRYTNCLIAVLNNRPTQTPNLPSNQFASTTGSMPAFRIPQTGIYVERTQKVDMDPLDSSMEMSDMHVRPSAR
jgi:hypothetical protein